MARTWIAGIALVLAITMPAVAQQRPVSEVLARLHTLCEQNYKPACIKFGFALGRLPTIAFRKLRRDHSEWLWWERW